MGVILETNQLCKFYGTGENQVKAVNHVNIQIQQGEFVAIVGNPAPEKYPAAYAGRAGYTNQRQRDLV